MISDVVAAGLPLAEGLHAHVDGLLAAPGHSVPLADKTIDTTGILEFITSKIAPILLAVLGLIFIGRANRGEVSRVLTSSAIAIVGLIFIGGAVTLLFLGNYLVNLIFT
jgi:hypothetical protein